MAKISSRVGALLFVVACLSGPARAAMLDPAEIDAARLLPPPPAADSNRAKAEIAELHAIASASSPALLEAARRDDGDEKPDLFNAALGFDVTALPATSKMLNDVLKEEDSDSKAAKAYFRRDRPWIVDTTIQTCAPHKPTQDHASYPSGHATVAYGMGVVLANLMPGHAQAILERSRQFAENRIICGMHFRSDTIAGQQFGTIMAIRLMQNPQFQADMAAARAELVAAHLAP